MSNKNTTNHPIGKNKVVLLVSCAAIQRICASAAFGPFCGAFWTASFVFYPHPNLNLPQGSLWQIRRASQMQIYHKDLVADSRNIAHANATEIMVVN